MRKLKSTIMTLGLAAVVLTTFGCYTEVRSRPLYEPAGAQVQFYYRDIYTPRYYGDGHWYYYHGREHDGRYRYYRR